MRHSNQKFTIGMMTIAITAMAAIGCMRPKTYAPDDSGLGAASFSVGKVELAEDGMKKLAEVDGFSIPTRKLYTLKTCVKSKKSERPAAHVVFELTGKNPEGKERDPLYVTTDAKGCFTWTEEIAFNFFGEEVYVPLERRLTATEGSGQRGSAKIRLALNPWNLSGSANEVVDLNQKDALPKGVEVKSEDETPVYLSGRTENASKQLSVSRFSLHSIPSQYVSTEDVQARDLVLAVEPAIRGLDAQKKQVEYKLNEGNLALDIVLVAVISDVSAGERKYTVWSQSDIPFTMTERGFTARISLGLPILDEDRVRYELFARVKTVPEILGLNDFEAIFTLGSHWQVLNSYVLPEIIQTSNVLNPNFSLDDSVGVLEKKLPNIRRPRPQTGEPQTTPQPTPQPTPAPAPDARPSVPSTEEEPGDQQTPGDQDVNEPAPSPEPAPETSPAPAQVPEQKEVFPQLPPHA